ncbi:MAG TPA: DUF2948 family protein [Dongiaceae bacterium]|jgi:hypothetical protein
MTGSPLKLSARDAEDLEVIAAFCQDALVPLSEMAYLEDEKRFVLVLNRFRWDTADHRRDPPQTNLTAQSGRDAPFREMDDEGPVYERVLCGLTFENVTGVRTRAIDLRKREDILAMLTIQVDPGAVILQFAGGGAIKLEVGELRCFMEDFGPSWPTRRRPRHPDDAGPAGSR